MPYPTATPESQGLDSSRLAKLTAWQEQMVADGKVRSKPVASMCASFPSAKRENSVLRLCGQLPCSEVVVARGGKVIYRQSAGEARPGVAVSEDSLYRIYSCVLLCASSTFCCRHWCSSRRLYLL